MKRKVVPVPRDAFAIGFFTLMAPGSAAQGDDDEAAIDRPWDVAAEMFPDDAGLAGSFAARFWALVTVLDRDEFSD